ncbi:hypothetical protein AD05_4739 [Escherichia coli 5-366-08_S4_C2]|nr:hypothetical protein FORC31_p324 [Escherichia coli]EMV37602.1 hypothetical protein ECBCE019MS13_3849 [Escherichia coli BCE019_MS-13]EMX11835.1 hypothetical protein ECP03023081_5217 [Escherichia coli P0302308.1]EMX15150.1 hypothetical protein ECP03022932_1751 [Escherichia coli P0302293.2]ENA26154.1 hypothetical protein ECBCE007MS11_5148 [Escherichia coli BCE007_MS-11]ENA75571.1 hypothetical protein EC2730450_3860 [Escherichia coli 2730450]ENB26564.1 hypothetical protein ECBCE032MS12_5345 [E
MISSFMMKQYLILSIINNTQIMQDMIFTSQNIVRWSVQDG